MVDELFNRLVGLFREFSEESNSVEGRRTCELALASSIRGKPPSHFLKVAVGRNDRNLRDGDLQEIVKGNLFCVVVSDVCEGVPDESPDVLSPFYAPQGTYETRFDFLRQTRELGRVVSCSLVSIEQFLDTVYLLRKPIQALRGFLGGPAALA